MIAEYLFQRQQSEAFQPGDRVRSRRPFIPGGKCLNGVVQETFTPKAPRRSRCPTIPRYLLPRYLVVWEDRSFGWYVSYDLEREPEYLEIAQARIAHWSQRPASRPAQKAPDVLPGQLSLFGGGS